MRAKTLRKAAMAVLAAAMLISGGNAIKTALEYEEEKAIYHTAQEGFVTILEAEVPLAQAPVATEPTVEASPQEGVEDGMEETVEIVQIEETPVPLASVYEPSISVNFQGLTQVNEDIVGWIHIPNTVISYPLLQGENNQSYLETTYDGRQSGVGSIFLDYRISGDFTDFNTIIYGHNVTSGTMFGSLDGYTSVDYAQSHPYFFLLNQTGYLRYQVCYAFVTQATSWVYDWDFSQEGSYETHIASLAGLSLYDLGVTIDPQDTIVTLSTCTNIDPDERLVVIGRLDQIVPSG